MSLDNIQLPRITLQQLFKFSLIAPQQDAEIPVLSNSGLKFLGGNQREIILLVKNKEAAYLPGDQLDFLMGILSACKLSMEDVALINIANRPSFDYHEITGNMKVKTVFIFGNLLGEIGLPFKIPEFQLQAFEEQTYLCAPSISDLQDNKELKRKLWLCLKQIFSL
jgi:hypothetical protein